MKKIIIIILFFLLQSCYFGIGLVEDKLPGKFMLFANNEYKELVITHNDENNSIYNIIIEETVFAVGYNKDFIIAKSDTNNKILYHIIEIKEGKNQKNLNLSFEKYKLKREELNLPKNLSFTIIYHQVAKD